MEAAPTHKYFKRSALILRVNAGIFLGSIIIGMILRVMPYHIASAIGALVALAGFGLMALAPVGLFMAIKSNNGKEGTANQRFLHMLGHMFFCTIDILIIGVFVSDLMKLFGSY